jgi:hypothetical protein
MHRYEGHRGRTCAGSTEVEVQDLLDVWIARSHHSAFGGLPVCSERCLDNVGNRLEIDVTRIERFRGVVGACQRAAVVVLEVRRVEKADERVRSATRSGARIQRADALVRSGCVQLVLKGPDRGQVGWREAVAFVDDLEFLAFESKCALRLLGQNLVPHVVVVVVHEHFVRKLLVKGGVLVNGKAPIRARVNGKYFAWLCSDQDASDKHREELHPQAHTCDGASTDSESDNQKRQQRDWANRTKAASD